VVSAAEAKARIDSPDRPLILDVREPDEFRAGPISGATLIPLGALAQRMNELPTGKTILCVCRSGSRSGVAARQLAQKGYQAVNLRGGMMGWQMAGYPIQRGR
jgi:rhodanese-related sulfurtransferase